MPSGGLSKTDRRLQILAARARTLPPRRWRGDKGRFAKRVDVPTARARRMGAELAAQFQGLTAWAPRRSSASRLLVTAVRREGRGEMATSLRRARASRARRRGIVLLFVLGLLALFSLVTVTYVLVARAHAISAMRAQAVEPQRRRAARRCCAQSGNASLPSSDVQPLEFVDRLPQPARGHLRQHRLGHGTDRHGANNCANLSVSIWPLAVWHESGSTSTRQQFGEGQLISLYSTGATNGSVSRQLGATIRALLL